MLVRQMYVVALVALSHLVAGDTWLARWSKPKDRYYYTREGQRPVWELPEGDVVSIYDGGPNAAKTGEEVARLESGSADSAQSSDDTEDEDLFRDGGETELGRCAAEEETAEAFTEWLRREGATWASGVRFGLGSEGMPKGYHWDAEGFGAGEVLVEIPSKLLLFAPPLDEIPKLSHAPERLVVALLKEWAAGEESLWAKWIATRRAAAPMLGESARSLLDGTYAGRALSAAKAVAPNLCAKIQAVVEDLPEAARDCDRVAWALHIVRVDALILSTGDHAGSGFIAPGSHLANVGFDAKLGWSLSDGTLKIYRATEAGAELRPFDHFPGQPNYRLFSLAHEAVEDNPYDSLPVTVGLPDGRGTPEDEELRRRRKALLDAMSIPFLFTIGRNGGVPRELVLLGRVATMEEEELGRQEELLRAGKLNSFFVSNAADASALQYISAQLSRLHAGATGSMRRDEASLKKPGLSSQVQAALLCRLSERIIVTEALVALWNGARFIGAVTEEGNIKPYSSELAMEAEQKARERFQNEGKGPEWALRIKRAQEAERELFKEMAERELEKAFSGQFELGGMFYKGEEL